MLPGEHCCCLIFLWFFCLTSRHSVFSASPNLTHSAKLRQNTLYPQSAAAAVMLLCSTHLFLPFLCTFPPLFVVSSVCFCYTQSTKNTHSTQKVRTFLGSEDILAGPCNFRGLLEGGGSLKLGLELGLGQGYSQQVSWDG